MPLDEEIDSLFENAMKGQWEKIKGAYRNSSKAQVAMITRSKETALHIAIADGQTEIALELVEIIHSQSDDNNAAASVLGIANDRGNTPLHLAARMGNVQVCHSIAAKAARLVSLRNVEGETPLFLAALNGNMKAFLCLHFHCEEKNHSLIRDNNGDTILHAAISGEYFSLAFQIIWLYPELVNSMNQHGWSPLHILASKPNAFQSSCRLGLSDRFIYHCLMVEQLKVEKYNHEDCVSKAGERNSSSYPENYATCMNFFQFLRSLFQVLSKKSRDRNWMQVWHGYSHKTHGSLQSDAGTEKGTNGPVGDEENPQQEDTPGASTSAVRSQSIETTNEISDAKSSRSTDGANHPEAKGGETQLVPPNYVSFVLFFTVMMKALLIILGIGFSRARKIQEKKERHIWANQVMNKMVDLTSLYRYRNTGQNPQETQMTKDKEECQVPNPIMLLDQDQASPLPSDPVAPERKDTHIETTTLSSNQHKYNTKSDQNEPERKNNNALGGKKNGIPEAGTNQSPVLIAAKMGVTEIVEKILDKFPVAIQDVDTDNKNVVLLAVENRQPHVYNLLQKRKILKESLWRQLDNEGNSALHLAATCGQYRPWLIPGAALQMQWEIKWYKFVKNSMPHRYFVRHNNSGLTPKEIFIDTHKHLLKEGSKWLTKTSESCSLVAALIATVAFATSATVPGGLDQQTGEPILKDKTAFSAFTISSLVALCFSITSLVFFLSILTSRYEESDFSMDLPRKLLMGLTSLFASIASMLVSFCTGHIFVLKHQLRYVAYPLYAATCLPVTFFALAQLPLYFDLMRAIIKKVPQRSYEVYTQ